MLQNMNNKKIQIFVNKIRTLQNGETLVNLSSVKCFTNSQENFPNKDLNENIENYLNKSKIWEKGLRSLENPVLRGSFILILSEEKLDFFDKIAKKAFEEIISKELVQIKTSSKLLPTLHLKTDPGKIQNGRPGVYVIQHRETGECIVGQTKDLKKRLNQYTSRSRQATLTKTSKIHKNFYEAAQKISADFDYSQVFQKYVVYTWVDENGKALDIESFLEFQNQMNYLEHRLILAFFESGFIYNLKDVAPQLFKKKILSTNIENIENFSPCTAVQTGNKAKPFRIGNHYFKSSTDYARFRKSLESPSKIFLSMPQLRKKLRKNSANFASEVRYLTDQEIQDISNANFFYSLFVKHKFFSFSKKLFFK
jgi:predicted GIY-YIG superfamily endonuclease